MLLSEIKSARELKVDLITDTFSGDKTLLNDLIDGKISEFDADDADENDEGNVDGTITIFLNDQDRLDITGENFSIDILDFNRLGDADQKEILSELIAKIKEVIK